MTTEQVQATGPELTAFLRPFERFFDTPKTTRHFRHYARGLLSDLPRKTAEPLALHAGVPPRNLQQFLKACLWDHDGLTDAVQRELLAGAGDPPADPVGSRREIKRNYSVSDEGESEQHACLRRTQPEVREVEHQHNRQRAIRKQAYEASNEQD